MKKLKSNLIGLTKINLIFFVFFVLFPSIKVQAMFNDTASINMGVKLELGTVSLAAMDTNIVNAASFTEGDSVLIASSKLVNDGSLTGKLAYKIDVTEGDRVLTADELKNTVITIDFESAANKVEATATSLNTNSFTFVENTSGSDVVIEPDSVGKVPVTVSYKSSTPTKEEKLKIEVTFRLIQSNAANANSEMFSDQESLMNTVTLVPEVVEEESYWPSQSTFVKAVHGNYTYSLEKMKMLFSETNDVTDPKKKYIKNLNKAILYIQFPDKERVTKQIEGKQVLKISQISTDNAAIKYESMELNEEHNGMIITFKLEDSYPYNPTNPNASTAYANKDRYELSLNIEIQKYGMYNKGEYGYYDNSHTYDQFFATRLVLSSDLVVPINGLYTKYTQLPIKLTKDNVILSFKKFNTTNPESADPKNFKDVQLTKEGVDLEVKGGQISSLLNSDKTFSLWLNSNKALDDATLNVKITGDTGNTLVISRKLVNGITSQSKSMKSMNMPLIEEETEEQDNQQTDTEINIEEPATTIDSTVLNEPTTEVPIEDALQEEIEDDGKEEVSDSSSVENISEIKEETIPIENSNQTTPEEISDE